MVRLLVISTVALDKNGISSCVLNYNRHIVSNEFDVDIIAPNIVEQDIKNFILSNNIKLYELPMRNNKKILQYFLELTKIIIKNKYDIVHVHGNSCTMAIELFAALISGTKTRIAHSHNTTCEHMLAHKVLRPLFDFSCNMRFACGKAAGKWLFKNRDFTVIKNGIDLSLYSVNEMKREASREQFGIKSDEIVLGHVGTFNYQKNHEFLVDLMKKLNLVGEKKFKLVLVGDGENKAKIECDVLSAGVSDNVVFTGSVANVPDFLQMMDIFLLPSRFEGLPYVLVEAQALIIPCLVSDNVSQESKLTESVHFLSLDKIDDWIDKIKTSTRTYLFRSNAEYVATRRKEIEDAGYDISKNAIMLKKIYLSLANAQKNIFQD